MLTEVTKPEGFDTVLQALIPLDVRASLNRKVTKYRIGRALMRAMGFRSHLDTYETFQVRKALKPEEYARALHDIALEQGVRLVQELLNELLTEHLAQDMEKTSNHLGHYLDRRGRALSQPRDAATGRFV